MKRRILVVGHERSGTSAVAGALARLGVPMQGPGPVFCDWRNPRGYYEDPHFSLYLNIEDRAKSDKWIEEYVAKRRELDLWGIKEPRLGIHIERLTRHFDREEVPSIVIVERNSDEVADSMKRATGRAWSAAWVREVQSQIVDNCRPYLPITVSYDLLCRNPVEQVERLRYLLSLSPSPGAADAAAKWVCRG